MSRINHRYEQLGHDLTQISCSSRQALRVNTLLISQEDLIQRLKKRGVRLEKIPFLDDAFWFEADFSLSSTQEYLLGYIYIQEPASQLPAHILLNDCKTRCSQHDDLQPVRILDMCAAPGSKTTQLAQLTQDKHVIVALDTSAPRLQILKNNLERLGISSVAIFKKDARFADDLEQLFDYILLDAPCSGNVCVEEDFCKKRTVDDFQSKAKTQRKMLRAAYKCLSLGGTLVYSTCSLEPEEDEEVIDWFIQEYPDMVVQEIDCVGEQATTFFQEKNYSQELKKTKKLWPDTQKTQGFFIAKLQKQSGKET